MRRCSIAPASGTPPSPGCASRKVTCSRSTARTASTSSPRHAHSSGSTHPDDALARMATATRPGGWVVVARLQPCRSGLGAGAAAGDPPLHRLLPGVARRRTDGTTASPIASPTMFTAAGSDRGLDERRGRDRVPGRRGLRATPWRSGNRSYGPWHRPMIETGAIDADGADAAAAAWEDWRARVLAANTW